MEQQSGPQSEDKGRAKLSGPGADLVARIDSLVAAGAPAWRIGPLPDGSQLFVPKTTFKWIGDGALGGFGHEHPLFAFNPKAQSSDEKGVRWRLLAAAMTTSDPVSFTHELSGLRQMGSQEVAQGRYLYAAALRDIAGLEWIEVAQLCRHLGHRANPAGDENDEREARRDCEKGRPLWHRLKAWPWGSAPESKAAPQGWHDGWISSTIEDGWRLWISTRERAAA